MPTYRVNCEWKMRGSFLIEAKSADEAAENVYANDNGVSDIESCKDSEYIDDSFEVVSSPEKEG